jgi:hypothetical protein
VCRRPEVACLAKMFWACALTLETPDRLLEKTARLLQPGAGGNIVVLEKPGVGGGTDDELTAFLRDLMSREQALINKRTSKGCKTSCLGMKGSTPNLS